MDRVQQMKQVQEEGLKLFAKKNKDYGDSFAQFGPIGVIIRMQDKINRLFNITKTNIALIESKSLRDTLIDLHNYSTMAIILLDEKSEKNVENSIGSENSVENSVENNVGNEKLVHSDSVGHALYLEDNGLEYIEYDDNISCWGQFK